MHDKQAKVPEHLLYGSFLVLALGDWLIGSVLSHGNSTQPRVSSSWHQLGAYKILFFKHALSWWESERRISMRAHSDQYIEIKHGYYCIGVPFTSTMHPRCIYVAMHRNHDTAHSMHCGALCQKIVRVQLSLDCWTQKPWRKSGTALRT